MINKYSNKRNYVRNPNRQEADQPGYSPKRLVFRTGNPEVTGSSPTLTFIELGLIFG